MKFVIVLALFITVAFAQTRPSPSELFETINFVVVKRGSDTFRGAGEWRVDTPGNKARELYRFEVGRQHFNIDVLQRYDTGKVYEIVGEPPKCNVTAVSGSLPPIWGWVPLASYKGRQTVDNVVVDVWSYTAASVTVSLGVRPDNVNVPVFLTRQSASETFEIHFLTWATRRPDNSWFNVPSICT